MFNYDSIGEKLKTLRLEKELSQTQLAKELNTTQDNISRLEQGKKAFDCIILRDIAKYFDVSTDYLLGLTDIKSTNIDLQAVNLYTGLNETAINSLIDSGMPYIHTAINEMCKSSFSAKLFRDILCYLNSATIEARKIEDTCELFYLQDDNVSDYPLINCLLYKIKYNEFSAISSQLCDNTFWESYFLMSILNGLKDLKEDLEKAGQLS